MIYKLLDEDASQVHASRASRTIDQDITVSLLYLDVLEMGETYIQSVVLDCLVLCDVRVKAYGTRVINNPRGSKNRDPERKKTHPIASHQAAMALNRRKHCLPRDINYFAIADH